MSNILENINFMNDGILSLFIWILVILAVVLLCKAALELDKPFHSSHTKAGDANTADLSTLNEGVQPDLVISYYHPANESRAKAYIKTNETEYTENQVSGYINKLILTLYSKYPDASDHSVKSVSHYGFENGRGFSVITINDGKSTRYQFADTEGMFADETADQQASVTADIDGLKHEYCDYKHEYDKISCTGCLAIIGIMAVLFVIAVIALKNNSNLVLYESVAGLFITVFAGAKLASYIKV